MFKKIINKTDYILIFSDLFELFLKHDENKIILSLEEIIDFLIKKKKTIILPTFNLNFPKTKKTSFSPEFIQTGFANKYLIEKYDFKRTKKPMYNFAVLGPKYNSILKLKQSTAWGENSVIGHLVKKKSTAIGLNINKKTFDWHVIHHCEEMFKVPYRYYKIFSGRNLDLNSKVYEKMYVRDLKSNYIRDGSKLNNILIKKRRIKNFNYKIINISLLNLYDYYIEAEKLLRKNIYSLVKNEKKS